MWCGSHAAVTTRHDSDTVCYCDECVGGDANSLYPCTACNVQYHIACHPFKWGRGCNGIAAPWCMECYADWMEEGPFSLHSGCLSSRGGTDITYDPDVRALARDLQPLPPLRKRRGRLVIRSKRLRNLRFKPLQPCDTEDCTKGCQFLTTERRQEHRTAYMDLVLDLKPKAKQRAQQYLFSLIKTEQHVDCEVISSQTVFYLHAGKGMVRTCRSFWCKTFGLGRWCVDGLVKLSRTEFRVSLSLLFRSSIYHCP
jgi:hypothetical protein